MARGRMLNNSISGNIKFHNLSDDTCRLLATWIIAHLDVRGVFHGDPAMVKSIIFPRRIDMTAEQVEGYLQEMESAGLIVRFQAKGDTWQWWPGFRGEQVGLRADREIPIYPIPPNQAGGDGQEDAGENPQDDGQVPADIRIESGDYPAEEKLSEVQGKVKLSEEIPPTAGTDAQVSPPPVKPTSQSQQMFTALAELCQVDWRICTDKQRGMLNRSEKHLRTKVNAVPADLPEFREWWYAYDWRGLGNAKKNRPPTPPKPSQVRETWGQFIQWRKDGKEMPGASTGRRSQRETVPQPISL